MKEKNVFTELDDNGNEVTCEILFTFDSEETKKSYMVYTDNTTDDEGNIKVYASIFDPNAKKTELIPIETDREWKIIETILESLQEDKKNNEE